MRASISLTLVLLPLLLVPAWANDVSDGLLDEAFGFSSEDSGSTSYLGVDISDVTADRLSALKLNEERGVEVTMVDQDAPAGKAGIREHDVILTMNGTAVESEAQLRRMIRETPSGRVVTFGISRDGQPLTIKVQLADRGKAYAWAKPGKSFSFVMPKIDMPDFELQSPVVVLHSSVRSGLMVENLTPQLGEFFGVKGGDGVLVRSVDKGSRADKAGFRAGDVIVRVNDQAVHDTSDFSHAFRSRNSSSIKVGVVSDKKEQTLTLTLPEPKDSSDVFEETFQLPEFDADTWSNLKGMQSEMAQIGPQLDLAIEQTQQAADKASMEARQAVENARKELCAHREELWKMQQELRQHAREMRRQLLEQQHELRQQQRDLHEMRHGFNGHAMDI